MIYPEHIRDISVISVMVHNKHKKDAKEEEQKQKHNKKNVLGAPKGGSGFYGHTMRFK